MDYAIVITQPVSGAAQVYAGPEAGGGGSAEPGVSHHCHFRHHYDLAPDLAVGYLTSNAVIASLGYLRWGGGLLSP